MLDRLVKNFGETDADYQSNVQADLDNIAATAFPSKAYRIEGWGFPGRETMDSPFTPTRAPPSRPR